MQSARSMAQRLEVWPVDRPRPFARNPRTHSDEQIDQLCRSMEEFGFTNPILVDSDDGIIAGHGRLAAARRLGLEEVPVVVLDGLTEDQRKAYLIADNRLPENAGWDEAQLSALLAELDDAEFDLSLIGFTDDELSELLAGEEEEAPGAGAEDDVPAEPETPASRPGDVWQLGKHRLACGDSTDADTVARALGGERPHLYAVRRGRTGHWQGARDQTSLWHISHRKSETGHSTQNPVEAMRRLVENNSRRGDAVYDPFCGSGTTIIAAEMTGRRCMAVELDPVYVDVGIERWQQYTGHEAVLEGDGRTFAEVRDERLAPTVEARRTAAS